MSDQSEKPTEEFQSAADANVQERVTAEVRQPMAPVLGPEELMHPYGLN